MLCATCGQCHGSSVPMRLAFYPRWGDFWSMWLNCWSKWLDHAKVSLSAVTAHEKWLCARLLVTLSLVDSFPREEHDKFRVSLGLFQLCAIQGVQDLRRRPNSAACTMAPLALMLLGKP